MTWLEEMPLEGRAALAAELYREGDLIAALMDLQRRSRESRIDGETARAIAPALGVPLKRLYELLTFYEMLGEEKRARIPIAVCDSTPCHYRNTREVVGVIREELGIGVGETTPDGLFSLRTVPCMGACAIGPILYVGETVYGNLTDEKIRNLIRKMKEGAR